MLIGLVGFIGSGKGTIADTLVERHGFTKESFARGVKDATSVIFGWDRDLLEGDSVQSRAFREQPDAYWSKAFGKEFSPRYALQLMGTEAGRKVFHENLWVLSLRKRIEADIDKHYVIADVRFPNEIDTIREMGGKIVQVKRGPKPEWYSCAYTENKTDADEHWLLEDHGELMEQKYPSIHNSEWAWIGCHYDMQLDNNCGIEEVPNKVDTMIDWLYNSHIEANEVMHNEIK